MLARDGSRFRHAGGDGQTVRQHRHRSADDRRAVWRPRAVRQLRLLGLHHGRTREAQAARRRPAQMGDGEAAAVARRAAFSRRRLSAAGGHGNDAGRPRQCARASARAATAAHRPAFAGGIFGRARLRLFLRRRSWRRAHRAHPRRRASLFQGPAERGRFVQVAGAASRHACRAPASRRKNSTISSAIAG